MTGYPIYSVAYIYKFLISGVVYLDKLVLSYLKKLFMEKERKNNLLPQKI